MQARRKPSVAALVRGRKGHWRIPAIWTRWGGPAWQDGPCRMQPACPALPENSGPPPERPERRRHVFEKLCVAPGMPPGAGGRFHGVSPPGREPPSLPQRSQYRQPKTWQCWCRTQAAERPFPNDSAGPDSCGLPYLRRGQGACCMSTAGCVAGGTSGRTDGIHGILVVVFMYFIHKLTSATCVFLCGAYKWACLHIDYRLCSLQTVDNRISALM